MLKFINCILIDIIINFLLFIKWIVFFISRLIKKFIIEILYKMKLIRIIDIWNVWMVCKGKRNKIVIMVVLLIKLIKINLLKE